MKKKIGHVFQEEKDRLLAFIRSRINRFEDSEDILQDVFLHTLNGISITEPIENLAGWLYVSARNRIIDYYRKKGRRQIRFDDNMTSVSLDSLISENHLHPETRFFRQLLADTISEAIETLPKNQKQVILWQMIEGRTFQEIAEMTGESINTLISRKRYAVQSLRKILKELHDFLPDDY